MQPERISMEQQIYSLTQHVQPFVSSLSFFLSDAIIPCISDNHSDINNNSMATQTCTSPRQRATNLLIAMVVPSFPRCVERLKTCCVLANIFVFPVSLIFCFEQWRIFTTDKTYAHEALQNRLHFTPHGPRPPSPQKMKDAKFWHNSRQKKAKSKRKRLFPHNPACLGPNMIQLITWSCWILFPPWEITMFPVIFSFDPLGGEDANGESRR